MGRAIVTRKKRKIERKSRNFPLASVEEFPDTYLVKLARVGPERVVSVTYIPKTDAKSRYSVWSSIRKDAIRIGYTFDNSQSDFHAFLEKFAISSHALEPWWTEWRFSYRDFCIAYQLFQKNPDLFEKILNSVNTIEEFVALAALG